MSDYKRQAKWNQKMAGTSRQYGAYTIERKPLNQTYQIKDWKGRHPYYVGDHTLSLRFYTIKAAKQWLDIDPMVHEGRNVEWR